MTQAASRQVFATALLAPEQPTPPGIRGSDRQSSEKRFAVHRNNVVSSLVDALSESFPVCRALVGDAFFRAMARGRVLADPPRSPVLIEYVEGFADFIAGFEPAASVPYLADVARIEALRIHAWHAADGTPVTRADYATLVTVPGRLATTGVRLHPACNWLHCSHAAHAIWSAHQGLADPADATLAGIDTAQAQDVLVARPELSVQVDLLPAGAIEFLDGLAGGESLAAAFDQARRARHDADPASLFAILVEHDLVVAIDTITEH